ncbi:hypothetical protein [Amycolatopsis sp. H20-H5]|uniref:hypothetical protein n=1 Tax=Amycolatopsis sp. H20-H5 TaxID=3046309 RepID=UPI002DB57BA2|nr:hypothetical protein [Amycolatopsis sp. H20-H5]MEC3978174.1 hypothetical protein [Amycolatopsis sp. H20-H5]
MSITVETERNDNDKAPIRAALRAWFVEVRDDGSRWTTSVRSWDGPGNAADAGSHGTWVWVDVEAVTRDSLEQVTIAAPKFMGALLVNGSSPRRLDVPVSNSPLFYRGEAGAEELASLITDAERDLPIVVFAPLPTFFKFTDLPEGMSVFDRFNDAVRRAATMATGMAAVCQLDEDATQVFGKIMGDSYAVRDGAFRIYLPDVDPAVDEAWRHRYTVPARFIRYRDTAGKAINRAISLRAGARRAPDSYNAAVNLLESARSREPGELQELLKIADEESAEHRIGLAALDQKYLSVVEDSQQLEEENNRLRGDLDEARKKLALAGPGLWSEQTEAMALIEHERLPDSADSPSVAALLAQEHFRRYLSFPIDACVDIDDIDSAVEARSWGETAWWAFRALNAYGEALASGVDPGSFWSWCNNSKHPYAWRATSKKLAMGESSAVINSTKLWPKRIFPVGTDLDKSGRMHMQAHIKIAEGGGPLAPRIYFYPSREMAKVYVGYFGPHRNVPNTIK